MYFKEKGTVNTEAAVSLAVKTARERGIKDIVVATSTGYTPSFFTEQDLKDFNIVVVTHSYGVKTPGVNDMEEERRAESRQQDSSLLQPLMFSAAQKERCPADSAEYIPPK